MSLGNTKFELYMVVYMVIIYYIAWLSLAFKQIISISVYPYLYWHKTRFARASLSDSWSD